MFVIRWHSIGCRLFTIGVMFVTAKVHSAAVLLAADYSQLLCLPLGSIILAADYSQLLCLSLGGVLLAADYSQLELRMIAHLSRDRKLINVLNQGGDVFKIIAAQWKMIDEEVVTTEQRQQAKQVQYSQFDSNILV